MSTPSLVCNLASTSCTHKAFSRTVLPRSVFTSPGRHPKGSLPDLSPVTKSKKARVACFSSIVIEYSGMDSQGQQADRRYIGRVLGPAPQDSDWWDKKLLSGAVVVPEIGKSGYRMYYYGRDTDK